MSVKPDTVNELLDRLSSHFGSESDSDVRHWYELIQKQYELTQQTNRQVVFVGEVGVGKSSALAVTTCLLLDGARPTTKPDLRKQSLLPTGAGRTTLCEVAIRAHQGEESADHFGLLLDPFSLKEMREIIRLWAEDEWNKRQSNAVISSDGDAPSNSQETVRALRAMAGYVERSETYREEGSGAPKRRTINPLEQVVPSYESPETFEQHLLERINLDGRIQVEWWLPIEGARSDLKKLLESVNAGTCSTALLPKRMTLVLPQFTGELGEIASQTQFVDSRGLDAGVRLSARADLQRFIEDPLAIYVLCTPFKSAPGDAVRELLKEVNGDARWASARERMVLALLDQGDAEQVNGAEGDRELGLEIKLDECLADLRQAAIISSDGHMPMVALDILQDDPEKLRSSIRDAINGLNDSLETALTNLMSDADRFLRNLQEGARRELLPRVNQQISEVLNEYFPKGSPMDDPMRGAFNAIQRTTYASVIYAACRRKGDFRNLNLYKAIESHAANAATAWITPPIRKVTNLLNALENDAQYIAVKEDIRLNKLRFEESKLVFVQQYSTAVIDEIAPLLQKDRQLWADCCANWGMANGFKGQVQDILKKWSERQIFKSHLEVQDKTAGIPFWAVLSAPQSAPRFTLHVKNLRALRWAVFSPEPVSLLVGANGAGKSTLLHSLKLLRLAYERGLAEAIRLVLGGAYALKNWSAATDEYLELGLSLGEAEWMLSLPVSNAGGDFQYQERLTYQGRTVFARDSITGLQYNGTTVYASNEFTALRVLVDRGEIHPAIQQVSDLLSRISMFEEPDLYNLRQQGSPAFDDGQLDSRGKNVLSILRKWQQDNQSRHRFDFVIQGMQAAFPSVSQIDFVGVANTLSARVYHHSVEQPAPLDHEANGLLQMLVLLANVAQSDPGGVVAIDEPENGLHPYAIRMFLRSCQQWALTHHVTLVLATHSLVLLDEFTATPEAVFVMKTLDGEENIAVPNALDQLCNRDWLEGFKLGDLYEQGEIGSNEDGR